jgi:hypothetical protein
MQEARTDAGQRLAVAPEAGRAHARHAKRKTRTLPPLRAIRARCIGCAESARAVRECAFQDCDLWPWRLGRDAGGVAAGDARRKRKAMRAYCIWCSGDQPSEPKHCPSVACPLWPYRVSPTRAPLDRAEKGS